MDKKASAAVAYLYAFFMRGWVPRDSVTERENLHRMPRTRRGFRRIAAEPLHALHDMRCRQRTFGGDETGLALGLGHPQHFRRLACRRFAELERHRKIIALDAPRSAMPRAALNHRDIARLRQ